MMQVKLFDMTAKEVGELTLNDQLFDIEYNEAVIHQAIVTRLANERQGTKSTLTRSEVRGGGIKPWRQKGTGRARQGSIRSPQWIHGGVVFAPKPRDFSKKMNLTAKRVAMFSALSQKIRDNEVIFVDALVSENGKTKEVVSFLKAFGLEKTVLFVMDNSDEKVLRASANIKAVSTIPAEQINTYDIVKNAKVVITAGAIAKIQEAYEV
ncbi:MAG: 50S ribosomal protein L4 [Clostridia bacterium]|nr:50S ribosomal protein L4 [Clostridia bacterium]